MKKKVTVTVKIPSGEKCSGCQFNNHQEKQCTLFPKETRQYREYFDRKYITDYLKVERCRELCKSGVDEITEEG